MDNYMACNCGLTVCTCKHELKIEEVERLKARIKSLEAQVDLLQRILAEYISNPKPIEPIVVKGPQ